MLAKRTRDIHLADRTFAALVLISGLLVSLTLTAIVLFLYRQAKPTFQSFGLGFFVTSVWDPVQDHYGALPVIFGTIASSLIAVTIALPLSVGIALFLTEVAGDRLARWTGFLVQMLAAIPSVVYGLWGVFVLAPWLRSSVEPWLSKYLGFLPLFQGPIYGVGLLAAGLILAFMIIPTISSISREIFLAIPQAQREAALALGSTRAEMMKIAVLRSSRTGILGATILGLGRALGETMAVTMVIGNRAEISASLFSPSQTMASVIANEYAEATSQLHLASLAGIGLTLFLVTFVISGASRVLIWRVTRLEGARS